MSTEDNARFDNAIEWIKRRWADHKNVHTLAAQMEVLGKNMAHLRGAKDPEARKNARVVWQKAMLHYWDLLWAIVEAKIDADVPDRLTFDPAERLLIDFGHLYSGYTKPNERFFEQLAENGSVDLYQYDRITDYISEQYAVIFDKPYSGSSSGVSIEEKLHRFNKDLLGVQMRRRMAMATLFAKTDIADKEQLDELLTHLEEGLQDAVETDMRTRRVREADKAEQEQIKEHCRRYDVAERTIWYLVEQLEKKLSGGDAPVPEPASPGAVDVSDAAENAAKESGVVFDPFQEIAGNHPRAVHLSNAPPPLPVETADDGGDYEATVETMREEMRAPEHDIAPDQSLKVIQNVLSLHDRTKFLANMIVHVTNENERWETRRRLAAKKYKGQGIPALKLELRTTINAKKDFMMLCARSARVDASPLCQNSGEPISLKRAGEIMMDLTPLDPGMLRASRIRMYGIPRVLMVPGQGLGVYDWEDNCLIIPIFDAGSDVKCFGYALAAFRWDNDEDRMMKDTYALLKQNKGKGIRALQEAFQADYFLWISKERKGYRVLPRDVSKWFRTFFKQKSDMAAPGKHASGGKK